MEHQANEQGRAAQDDPGEPPAGTYVWDVAADRWWWSDELYAMHGFTPGEVVPSTGVQLAHKHPEDLEKVLDVLGRAREHGGRFSCYHRIVDTSRKVRHVLMVGGATTEAGRVVELSGFVVDLTRTRRDELQPSIEQALEGALEHRSAIDMAKGAVMLGYGMDPDQAFALLRSSSVNSNVKLHQLAERLVDELALTESSSRSHERLDALLARVTDPRYGCEPVLSDPAGTRP